MSVSLDRATGGIFWPRSPKVAVPWFDLLALLAHVGITVLFFWPILGMGRVPAGYDLLTYFLPYKGYLAELVRQGEPPLWNPLIFMGAPLLANPQAAALYPPDLLFYLLPLTDALRYSVALHVFLAAGFTYLFGRGSLGLSPLSAWVAGTVFAFGGYIGAQTDHLNQLHAAVWLPLLLLCLERAVAGRNPVAAAVGALVLATQLLAGHTQQLYYSGWALGLFALFLALYGGLVGWGRLLPFLVAAFMGVTGTVVAGAQLLPTLELAGESYRSGGIPFAEAVTYSVPLEALMDSLLPLYFATPYVELIGYTGILALVMAPAALAWRRRPRYQWYFLGLASLAILLSLGDHTPLYGWLFRIVPGFDLFRAPARWLFLYSFSLAVLAGMGLESLREPLSGEALGGWMGRYGIALGVGVALLVGLRLWLGSQDQEWALPHPRVVMTWSLFAGAAMAACTMVRAWPRSRLLAGGLTVLLLLDLYLAREPLEYNHPTLASLYTDPRPLYSTIGDGSSGRVLSLARDQITLADEAALRRGISNSLDRPAADGFLQFTRLKEALTPNLAMAFGIGSVDGYDGGLLPTRRYARWKQAILGAAAYRPDLTLQAQAVSVPSSRLLAAFGVRYLLLDPGLPSPDPGWEQLPSASTGSVRLLRNTLALPRAYLVHSALLVPDEAKQLEAVGSQDLRETVILGQPVDFRPPRQTGSDSVEIVGERSGGIEVAASLEEPGFLVLSDSYYPGWKVYVDGREAPLLRANFALRAVQLEPGKHRVIFAYQPDSLRFGLILSGLGLATVAGTLILPLIRR